MTDRQALWEPFENNLRERRIAAGIDAPERLAALAGLDPEWYRRLETGEALPTAPQLDALVAALGAAAKTDLYPWGYVDSIGLSTPPPKVRDFAEFFSSWTETAHLFVTPQELSWLERPTHPGQLIDVVVNMSCSTQLVPNLLLDTVSVLRALDVNFIALAGRAACCGKPYRKAAQSEASDRMNVTALRRATEWGATTHVNWCTSCQITYSAGSARRIAEDPEAVVLREVQLLTFLDERLAELGTAVPWRGPVTARVLLEGGAGSSGTHDSAVVTAQRMLARVPGITVADLLKSDDPAIPDGPRYNSPLPATSEGVARARAAAADFVHARRADTLSCQHQYSHKRWSYYAGNDLVVRNPVSLLAEALGVRHPDRFQAAVGLGEARRVVDHTREIWSAWGMDEARALKLAGELFDPIYADADACHCGGEGSCARQLITLGLDPAEGVPS